MKRHHARPPRLIDLHVDWPLQYVGETTQFDPADYPEMMGRVGQVAGYLQTTSAAVVACFRSAADWARYAVPWLALMQLLARVEAEFPGRILAGPEDHARWKLDTDDLTWAIVGVEGFDFLVRQPSDLERLDGLFGRGVRVYQPIHGAANLLGGSCLAGDDRGLTPLGRDFLGRLVELGDDAKARPLLDIAHMNARTRSDVLDWFESAPERLARLLPIFSHGGLGGETQRALNVEHLVRLRALGGHLGLSVGPPHVETAEALQRAIEQTAEVPFVGTAGVVGISLGTNFPSLVSTISGLHDAEAVVRWLMRTFGPTAAPGLIAGHAERLVEVATGAPSTT